MDKTIRRATDSEELVCDAVQPLLEIAEGTRDIEKWNDYVMKLLDVVNALLLQQKQTIAGEITKWLSFDGQEVIVVHKDQWEAFISKWKEHGR